MPRFCTHCGKLLKDDERFCTSCGTPATDDGQASQVQEGAQTDEHAAASDAAFDTAATTVQPAQPEAAQQADVTVQSAHQPTPAPQPGVGATQQWATPASTAPQQPIPTAAPQAGVPTAPKNNNALLIGIIAVLVVVIFALVVLFMLKPFDKGADDSKGTTIEKVKIDHDDDDVSVKGDPNKLDDDDDDGYDDYEIDDGGEYESNDAPAAAAQAAYRTAVPTPDAGFAAPSASAYTESTRPIADIYDDIKIPEAPSDKYDEVGGESALLRENRELRRLLAEEREKVEILKKSLHICTQPTKK